MTLLDRLQAQHHMDWKVYRSAHNEPRNVLLHKILIPIECWSSLMLLWLAINWVVTRWMDPTLATLATLLKSVPHMVTLMLGILSLVLAKRRWVGIATLVFHIGIVFVCEFLLQFHQQQRQQRSWAIPILVLSSWSLAWMLQVGVGHYLLEGNAPNVANLQDVSYLAMCQSVLLAWSI
jgi:uncharacterized membrane protein YGL010W